MLFFLISLSIITGIVGTIVVLKKMSSITGSISHSLLASVSLAELIKVNPLVTSIPFVLILSTIIHYIKQNKKIQEETALSIIWVASVALGIIFINLSKTYSSSISFYLFGNILLTDKIDIIISWILAIISIIFIIAFKKQIVNIIIDEEYSKIININTNLYNILTLALMGLAIALTIKAIGIILLIAIFSIPSTIAYKNSRSIEESIILSSIISFSSFISGYYISYWLNLPISSTITIVLLIIFVFSNYLKYLKLFKISRAV